jgi:hypothetical protein
MTTTKRWAVGMLAAATMHCGGGSSQPSDGGLADTSDGGLADTSDGGLADASDGGLADASDGGVPIDAAGDAATDAPTPPENNSGVAVLFVDVQSGPTSGGPSNHGVPISIFGRGFGASRGSSTATIGGVEVSDYLTWGAANANNRWLDMIVVQPGPNVRGGPIVVNVGGKASNADQTFTVRAGTIYVVSTNGSDSAACSLSAPCANIGHVASDVMKAGDFLLVHGGTYTGDTVWIRSDQGQSGAAGMPKVIKNYPGESPEETNLSDNFLVDANYITVSGLGFPDGASLDLVGWASANQQGDRLINNSFRGTTSYDAIGVTGQNHFVGGNDCELSGSSVGTEGHCYYIAESSNIDLAYNLAEGEGGYGIHIHEEVRATPDHQRIIQHVLVHGNVVTGSPQRSGMIVQVDDCSPTCYKNYASDIQFYDNIVYANDLVGIEVNGIAQNVTVYNNTFYQNGLLSLGIGGTSPSQLSGVDVANNAFYQGANSNCQNNCTWFPQGHVQIDSAAKGVTVRSNYYGPGSPAFFDGNGSAMASPDSTATTGNILFVNAAQLDFHLQSGSVAIDKGVTLSSVPYDFDGLSRPQGSAYDLGAYEYKP